MLLATSTGSIAKPQQTTSGDYLFVWARHADGKASDFLAVIDSNPRSPTYGKVLTTADAGESGTMPHHTEHEMGPSGELFANGFGAGRTFRFDLRDPLHPRLLNHFDGAGPYMHAHSFARLPNGHVLATYQMRGHDNDQPGALVEHDADGRVIRMSDAADPAVEPFIRPYSVVAVPKMDRVVTTSADMHGKEPSHVVQLWRLSDLKLLQTIRLPNGPRGDEGVDPAEARVLGDGRTVMVGSFNCGLFRLSDLRRQPVSASLVHDFDGGKASCALPVVAGRYWVQTDANLPGLVAMDVSNPGRPREMSRLTLGAGKLIHWISLSPDKRRIVISGGGDKSEKQILIATIDPATGKLALDPGFREEGAREPGISFDRRSWPGGDLGPAIPHGAVFSR
jgi:hypothetical protein